MIIQLPRAAKNIGPVVWADLGDVINLLHVHPRTQRHRQCGDVFLPQQLCDPTIWPRVGARSQDDSNAAGVRSFIFVIDVDNQILDGLVQEGCISSSVMQVMNILFKQPLLNLNE